MTEPLGLDGARVFVTGGHGFIGGAVVRLLAESGAQVVAPYKHEGGPAAGLPAAAMELDLLDDEAVCREMAGADHVVHLAARSGGIQFQGDLDPGVFYDNQRMTRNVLVAAAAEGVRRTFIASSGVVYAPGGTSPITEDSRLIGPGDGAVQPYAWSKVCDEVVARWFSESGRVATVAGRFTNVYGPGGSFDPERATVVHSLVQRAVQIPADAPLEVWGDGTPLRSFVYVDDAARAVVTILTGGEPGTVYNIDSSQAVTIGELASAVSSAAGRTGPTAYLTDRPQGAARRVLDNSRLLGLGFRASVSLGEGVRRTVEACRRHPRE